MNKPSFAVQTPAAQLSRAAGCERWMGAGRRMVASLVALALTVTPTMGFAAPPPPDPSDELTVQPAQQPPTNPPEPVAAPETKPAAKEQPRKPSTAPKPKSKPPQTSTLTPEEAAREANRAEASKIFDEGRRYYAMGDYLNAITNFQRAFELSNEPLMLYNLGQAHWKRYDVDPNLDHLRRARDLFVKFDKIMLGDPQLSQGYNHDEIQTYINEIDARIRTQEEKNAAAEKERLAVAAAAAEEVRQRGPNAQQRAELRRERANLAMKWTGTGAIIVGSLALLAGGIGLAVRGGTGLLLNKSSDAAKNGANFNNAKDDERQRNAYLVGGRLAFGTLLAAGVLIPVGITLRVIGGTRLRRDDIVRDRREKQELEEKCKLAAPMMQTPVAPQKVSWKIQPGSLLRIEF